MTQVGWLVGFKFLEGSESQLLSLGELIITVNPLILNQVSIHPEYLQTTEKKDRYLNGYLYQKNTRQKDRHKLNFKTRHWVRFLKQENYLLTSLADIFKNSLSGGCEISYIALSIDNKNLFFFKNRPTGTYYLEKQKDYLFSHLFWREKEELERTLKEKPRQFRKKWQEIKLKTEILSQWDNPVKLVAGYKENGRPKPTWEGVGWNSPNYWEPKNRSLAALAFTHEIVLGKVDVPLLDLDPNKKDKEGNYKIKQEWLRKDLSEGGKKWKALINKHQIPYYWKTATPGNSLLPVPFWLAGAMAGRKIYHQDTRAEVADLLGKGDLVALPVGSDKSRQLVITEWGRKLVKKYGAVGIFNKKLLDGNVSERIEELLNKVFLTLDKPSIHKPRSRKKLIFRRAKEQKKANIKAKILSKHKTPLLHLWKAFYFDWKTKTTGYFLINDYQRNLDDLVIGETKNIMLVSGWKHNFFNRIQTNRTQYNTS